MTYRTFDTMPFVINVIDVADTLHIGRNAAYNLVNSGQIKSVKMLGNVNKCSKNVLN